MTSIPSLLIAMALIGFGCGVSANAQAEQPRINLRLLALPPKSAHPPLYLIQESNTAIPLEVATTRLTGPFEAVLTKTWRFSLADKPAEKNGKISIAARCKVIPSAAEQLVVLVKESDNPPSYGAFAVDIGPVSFKERQFLIVNLTSKEIAGDVGGKRVAFPPGKPVFVAPNANISEDLCHAAFLTREAEKPWQPFFSTNWPLKDKVRGLIFFYQGPGGRKILMHTVSDFL